MLSLLTSLANWANQFLVWCYGGESEQSLPNNKKMKTPGESGKLNVFFFCLFFLYFTVYN